MPLENVLVGPECILEVGLYLAVHRIAKSDGRVRETVVAELGQYSPLSCRAAPPCGASQAVSGDMSRCSVLRNYSCVCWTVVFVFFV